MSNVETKVAGELSITMNFQVGYCEYVGTRAEIESEGIIQSDVKWPIGFRKATWTFGRFSFYLIRRRPKGVKGPRRDFEECDRWCLRWHYKYLSYEQRAAIEKKRWRDNFDFLGTPGGLDMVTRAYLKEQAAKRDTRFKEFMRSVVGGACG
ncbi:hypothetical protein QYH69_15800 [Paraburkholderia sp. SARCC-3016]|uniref:hypothetical protein n=1 Tax=Paraburkholderia sp. SARCC-3016 TaxID=3058611 RepID=UPI00280A257F|nr:hypothetical protein [Paraburkholderia sp. SARCC-3016]MDQ7978715.1 hypothetical protein [Paraburkholderia sp. SARCC-3016]